VTRTVTSSLRNEYASGFQQRLGLNHRLKFLNGSSSPVLTATCLSHGRLCDFPQWWMVSLLGDGEWHSRPTVTWLFCQSQCERSGQQESKARKSCYRRETGRCCCNFCRYTAYRYLFLSFDTFSGSWNGRKDIRIRYNKWYFHQFPAATNNLESHS